MHMHVPMLGAELQMLRTAHSSDTTTHLRKPLQRGRTLPESAAFRGNEFMRAGRDHPGRDHRAGSKFKIPVPVCRLTQQLPSRN